ncbi:MAG TPA: YraN family protein [Clostridia bacterium]|nr:YraN family protein [Clostridia bacterium]
MNNKELGDWGEQQAKGYLKSQGFIILEKNYRSHIGEVDLIAKDGDFLVFVEVKTRTSKAYGFPMEAIGPKKQNKYFKMASIYAKHRGIHDVSFRFDIIEVMVKYNSKPDINHIPNAFQPHKGNYYW